MKLLCLCPIGIGNYLLCYPAFHALHKGLHGAELHLLALRKGIAEFAQEDPLWTGIRFIDPTHERSLLKIGAFLAHLQRERFDASLSFFPSNTWQYNLLPSFCGIRKRHAFSYHLKKGASLSFLNNRLLPVDSGLHDVDQNLRLAEAFIGKGSGDSPRVFPSLSSEGDRDTAAAYLAGLPGPKKFIAIHPGSSGEHGMDAKRWDPMRFGELADRICGELGAQALILGAPDEDRIKGVAASVMKAPRQVVEAHPLGVTAAMIHQCELMLCNDSGLMHMAAISGVPVAAVFGPTDERRNGPVGTGHLVIRKQMDGFPLWTAANVGVRAVPHGMDPAASLRALSVDDAWAQVGPWLLTLGR